MDVVDLLVKQPGKYFCFTTKDQSGNWEEHWFTKSELRRRLPEHLEEFKDCNNYFCPHGFKHKRRVKDNAVPPLLLYADLDEVNPVDIPIRPTLALRTSPGRFAAFWQTDEPITEDLNQRLSYSLGADKSGWDFTQVLRVPNTINYKYPKKPQVKVIMESDRIYEVKKLNKMIPPIEDDQGREFDEDAYEIYKKYEKKLDAYTRRELLQGKPTQGKRSEVLWKLCNNLVEAGLTTEEIFELLWISPWNKFAERRGGERQLRREIKKATGRHLGSGNKKGNRDTRKSRGGNNKVRWVEEDRDDDEIPSFISHSMQDISVEPIEWIIPKFLAREEITIVEGDPSVGKSWLLMWLARHLCDGKKLPFVEEKYNIGPYRIMYWDIENSSGKVTKARLLDTGMKNFNNYYQIEKVVNILDEDVVDRIIADIKQNKLDVVIFDTVNKYMGDTDTHKATETAQALEHFNRIAKEGNCAIVLVRHLTKSSKEGAMYRGQGSIQFIGTARMVFTVGRHPDDPEFSRVCSTTKINLALPAKSFAYKLESLPDTPDRKDRGKLTYLGHVDYNSDEILTRSKSRPTKKKECNEWLKELLEANGGELMKQQIFRAGQREDFTPTMIYKASAELGIVKDQKAGKWYINRPSVKVKKKASQQDERRTRSRQKLRQSHRREKKRRTKPDP